VYVPGYERRQRRRGIERREREMRGQLSGSPSSAALGDEDEHNKNNMHSYRRQYEDRNHHHLVERHERRQSGSNGRVVVEDEDEVEVEVKDDQLSFSAIDRDMGKSASFTASSPITPPPPPPRSLPLPPPPPPRFAQPAAAAVALSTFRPSIITAPKLSRSHHSDAFVTAEQPIIPLQSQPEHSSSVMLEEGGGEQVESTTSDMRQKRILSMIANLRAKGIKMR
jgi:hypothetical protein